MGIIDDPISGTIGALLTHGLEKSLMGYFRLAYALGLSATICFLVVAGGTLATTQKPLIAIGSGMVVAGLAMLRTFQVSKDAKEINIAIVNEVAQATLDHETVVIDRSKQQ
jgi:hypothetical protein